MREAPSAQIASEKGKPVRRKELPAHFERVANVIESEDCVCPDCGGALSALGKPDESEVMEVKTVTFTVTKHIRPKKRCSVFAQAQLAHLRIGDLEAGGTIQRLNHHEW